MTTAPTAEGDPAAARKAGRAKGADASPDDEHAEAESRRVDYVDLMVAAKNSPKSLGRLPRLLMESARLVWQADRKGTIVVAAIQLAAGVIVFLQVWLVRRVLFHMTTVALGTSSVIGAMPSVIALVAVMAVSTVSSAVLVQQQRLLSELVARTTWREVLGVSASVELSAFESTAFFDQFTRVRTNAVTRPYSLTQALIGLLGGITGTIGVSVALISIKPILLPLLLLAGIPLWITGRSQGKAEFAFAVSQTPRIRLRNYLLRLLSEREPAKELRAFGFGSVLRGRFDDTYGDYIRDLRRHAKHRSALAFAGSLLASVILGASLVVLVWMVGSGWVSLSGCLAGLVAIRLMGTQITSLFGGVQQMFESGLFIDDLNAYLQQKTDLQREQGTDRRERGAEAPARFTGIELGSVSFTYPGSTEPALRDISMRVRAGEVVALVGENGSGKTTLAKQLALLYEPDAGTIRWDGVDVRTLDRAELRRHIAIIFQDFIRYELSVRDNIEAGLAGDDDRVATAARHAGIAQAIEELPLGYDTLLSKQFKGGRDLSLGQWQRLALARAFYRDSPLVILDEPSASLDPRAEYELFSRIRELLVGRAVLFVSHRFSTVRSADRIYVMANGKIVEQGTHDELMASGQSYAEMFTLQATAYLNGPVARQRRQQR